MTPDLINNFNFWYSIFSTVIGIILLVTSVGLIIKSWLDSKNQKVQVKIWMQDANGISLSLQRIVKDNLDGRYSSTNDIANAIWSIQASAFALYQSLYEERCISEKEFIEDQQRLREDLRKQNKRNIQGNKGILPPSPISPPIENKLPQLSKHLSVTKKLVKPIKRQSN